ncbi:MAG: WD40 repeat domain-containing protein [Bacteroidota bacterium]
MYHLYKKYAKAFMGSLLLACSGSSLHATQVPINSQAGAPHPLLVEGYVKQKVNPSIIIKPINAIINKYTQPIRKIEPVSSFSIPVLNNIYLGHNDFSTLSYPCSIQDIQVCTLYEGDITGKTNVHQLVIKKHQSNTMFCLLLFAHKKFILTSSDKDKLKLWDPVSGEKVKEFSKPFFPIGSCNPLNNSLFITTDKFQKAAIWSLKKFCPLLEYKVSDGDNFDFFFNKRYIFFLTDSFFKAQISVYETNLRKGQAALQQVNRWSIDSRILNQNGLLLCADAAICLTIDEKCRLIKWKVGKNQPPNSILLEKQMITGGCCLLSETRMAFLGYNGTKIQIYDIAAMKAVKIIPIKGDPVIDGGLKSLSNHHFFAHSAKKNNLMLFSTPTLEYIATISMNHMRSTGLNYHRQQVVLNNIVTIAPKQFVIATYEHVYLFVITDKACQCIHRLDHTKPMLTYNFISDSNVFSCTTENQTDQSKIYLFKYT